MYGEGGSDAFGDVRTALQRSRLLVAVTRDVSSVLGSPEATFPVFATLPTAPAICLGNQAANAGARDRYIDPAEAVLISSLAFAALSVTKPTVMSPPVMPIGKIASMFTPASASRRAAWASVPG